MFSFLFFTLASNKKRTFHSFFSFPHPFALQLSPIFTHFNIHKTIDFLCDCLFIFKAANISTNFIFNSSEKKNSVFFRRSFSFCFVIKWNAMLETSWRYIRMRFSGHYLYTFIPIEWIFHRYVLLLEMKYHAFFSILIGSVQQFDVHSRFMLFSFQLKY